MAYHGDSTPTGKDRIPGRPEPERPKPPEPDPLLDDAVEEMQRRDREIQRSR